MKCPECSGSGQSPYTKDRCQWCRGKGETSPQIAGMYANHLEGLASKDRINGLIGLDELQEVGRRANDIRAQARRETIQLVDTDMQHTAIFMPSVSPAMTQGTITKWHKKNGEHVRAGDIIADVEMGDTVFQIEAVDDADEFFTRHKEGGSASINEAIAVLQYKEAPKFYMARILLRWQHKPANGAESRTNMFYMSRPYYGAPGPEKRDPMSFACVTESDANNVRSVLIGAHWHATDNGRFGWDPHRDGGDYWDNYMGDAPHR